MIRLRITDRLRLANKFHIRANAAWPLQLPDSNTCYHSKNGAGKASISCKRKRNLFHEPSEATRHVEFITAVNSNKCSDKYIVLLSLGVGTLFVLQKNDHFCKLFLLIIPTGIHLHVNWLIIIYNDF